MSIIFAGRVSAAESSLLAGSLQKPSLVNYLRRRGAATGAVRTDDQRTARGALVADVALPTARIMT